MAEDLRPSARSTTLAQCRKRGGVDASSLRSLCQALDLPQHNTRVGENRSSRVRTASRLARRRTTVGSQHETCSAVATATLADSSTMLASLLCPPLRATSPRGVILACNAEMAIISMTNSSKSYWSHPNEQG